MTNPNQPPTATHRPELHIAKRIAIGFHALAATVYHLRMERAGTILERMDHKDALYHDIGYVAITGHARVPNDTPGPIAGNEFFATDTAKGIPAQPRTPLEDILGGVIDKRGRDLKKAKIYAYQHEKIHGRSSRERELTPAEQQRALGDIEYWKKQLGQRKIVNGERIDELTDDAKQAPNKIAELRRQIGSATRPRVNEMGSDISGVLVDKTLLPGEKTNEIILIKGQPNWHGESSERVKIGGLIKAQKKFDAVTDDAGFLAQRRDKRRERAIGRIQEHWRDSEHHRQSAQYIRSTI